MFGFPADFFGMSTGHNHRMSPHSLIPHHQSMMMMPSFFAGGIPSPFDQFAMMGQMMRGAPQHFSAEPMQSFTSTTVMSFNGTDGQPKIYQESTSHRRGPGGIEETRQAVRDSERGINKVRTSAQQNAECTALACLGPDRSSYRWSEARDRTGNECSNRSDIGKRGIGKSWGRWGGKIQSRMASAVSGCRSLSLSSISCSSTHRFSPTLAFAIHRLVTRSPSHRTASPIVQISSSSSVLRCDWLNRRDTLSVGHAWQWSVTTTATEAQSFGSVVVVEWGTDGTAASAVSFLKWWRLSCYRTSSDWVNSPSIERKTIIYSVLLSVVHPVLFSFLSSNFKDNLVSNGIIRHACNSKIALLPSLSLSLSWCLYVRVKQNDWICFFSSSSSSLSFLLLN